MEEEKLCSRCNKLIDENEDWHIITKEGNLVCMECYGDFECDAVQEIYDED